MKAKNRAVTWAGSFFPIQGVVLDCVLIVSANRAATDLFWLIRAAFFLSLILFIVIFLYHFYIAFTEFYLHISIFIAYLDASIIDDIL